MKKYILGVCVALFGAMACTDLEPKLYSSLTTGNAYSTESDINAALAGLYGDLNPYPGDAWQYYGGYLVMTTDYATDMGFSTAAGDPTKLSQMTYDDNNRYFRYNYQMAYQVVTNANILIKNVADVNIDDTKKAQIIAQAKFLRALAYRDLTDAFGPVPFVTEPVDLSQAKDAELTPVEEITEYLCNDLKECVNVLPKSWEVEKTKATKGAAATLLGKLYMRDHKYAEAKPYIQMVLDLEKEGVYQLLPDFKEVWTEANKWNKEFIFCILHDTSSNGAEIACHFGPSDHQDVPGRWQYYGVSLPFWRSYSDADPRKEFFYYDYTSASQDSDGSHFTYRIPRVGQTSPDEPTDKLMQNVATKKYTYKMASDAYYDGRTISIFRMSDVILCMAEIENNLSGAAAALPYINRVRERAGAPLLTAGSKEAMNDAILAERGWELVFEFQRRADLIRFGKYESTVNAHLANLNLAKPATITEKNRYFPYPLVESNLNVNMKNLSQDRIPR